MYLTKIKVALLCYRYYFIAPAALSVFLGWLYLQGSDVTPILFMKLSTDGLIWYFISALWGSKFYYYYNLHVSKTMLFATWLIVDLILCIALLWLITLIK